MKIYFLLIFFIFNILTLTAQNYEVLYVKGKIRLKEKGVLLKKANKFTKSNTLTFSATTDGMIVSDTKTKRNYMVRPMKKDNKLIPKFSLLKSRAQGRPGKVTNGISLVKFLNEGNNYLVLGNSTHIPIVIGNAGFTFNKDTFLYLEYDYKGLSIAKKLKNTDKGLLIHKDSTFRALVSLDEYHRILMRDNLVKISNPKKDTLVIINPREITVSINDYKSSISSESENYYTNMKLKCRDFKNGQAIKFKAPKPPNYVTPISRSYIPFNLVFLEEKEVAVLIEIIKESGLYTKEEFEDRVIDLIEEEYRGKVSEGEFRSWIGKYSTN